jgi:hypothetical protein
MIASRISASAIAYVVDLVIVSVPLFGRRFGVAPHTDWTRQVRKWFMKSCPGTARRPKSQENRASCRRSVPRSSRLKAAAGDLWPDGWFLLYDCFPKRLNLLRSQRVTQTMAITK